MVLALDDWSRASYQGHVDTIRIINCRPKVLRLHVVGKTAAASSCSTHCRSRCVCTGLGFYKQPFRILDSRVHDVGGALEKLRSLLLRLRHQVWVDSDRIQILLHLLLLLLLLLLGVFFKELATILFVAKSHASILIR